MKSFIIAQRELKSMFLSPVAYVFIAIFSVITAWFFTNIVALFAILSLQALRVPWLQDRINLNDIVIKPFFGNVAVVLLFIIPMITMRAFAEEKKTGTFELLYTSPISQWQLVLGKFLGIFFFIISIIFLSFQYPIYLAIFTTPDWGSIISSYLGILLISSAFISAGIFASSITENQVISVIVSFGILLLFWVLGWARENVSGTIKEIVSYLSFMDHFQNFTEGLIDTKDIIYYISFTAIFLYLSFLVLESRRWRGAY